MIMLPTLALPIAPLGFVLSSGDEDTVEEIGAEDADLLEGGKGSNVFDCGADNDVMSGRAGEDAVFGGVLEALPLNLEQTTALRDARSLADIHGGIQLRNASVRNGLSGGTGDDDLVLGSGDVADGRSGFDTLHVMSGRESRTAQVISNYVPKEDAIISLGETTVARASGGIGALAASDVTLIAASTVMQLFEPIAAAA